MAKKNQQLENLVKIKKLKAEEPSADEFNGLVSSGKARLKDADNKSLSLESRFDLAYNSSHSLALAALRFCGYRPDDRYIVFQCLPHTLGLSDAEWRILDDAHRRRNNAEYSGLIDVDEAIVKGTIEVAKKMLTLMSKLKPIEK